MKDLLSGALSNKKNFSQSIKYICCLLFEAEEGVCVTNLTQEWCCPFGFKNITFLKLILCYNFISQAQSDDSDRHLKLCHSLNKLTSNDCTLSFVCIIR